MKKILETARVFFISPELLLVVIGFAIQQSLTNPVERLLANINISDDFLKWAIAIPGALLCWSLVSGRKLLFPEKDKNSILQKWPDYWILKNMLPRCLVMEFNLRDDVYLRMDW